MQYESLSADQIPVYEAAIAGSHNRHVDLAFFRRSDGTPVTSSVQLITGSIQGDVERTPVTFLDADLLDPDFTLDWSNGAQRRFEVRVTDSRFVPDLDDWVDRVVFTGVVWTFSREGAVVSIVAEGPEINAMGTIRNPQTYKEKTPATTVIRGLLKAAGAVRLRIPSLSRKLPRDVTVGVRRGKKDDKKKHQRPRRRELRTSREDTYWGEAEPIAEAIDRDLYATGRGAFVLEPPPTKPSLVLTNRMLTAPVKETPALDGEAPNTWLVLGADPKGPKPQVKAEVALPKRHPASAHSMRWNDTPREVTVRIENNHLRTDAAARRVGERRRDQALRERLSHEVQVIPCVSWVRPGMLASFPVGSRIAVSRVKRWTLPLGPGADPVSLGANRSRGWRG